MLKISIGYTKIAGIFLKMILIAFVFVGCMASCSCEATKKSVTHYGYAVFNLQWDDSIPVKSLPQTLCYCFYPLDGGPMIQTEGDTYNLRVALPHGSYRLLIFSTEIEDMKLRNMAQFKHAEVSFSSMEEEICSNLSSFYGTSIDSLLISSERENEYNVSLRSLVRDITVNVKVVNKEIVASCKADLLGVPSSLNFSTRNTGTCEHISVPFVMESSSLGFEKTIQVLNSWPEKYPNCLEGNLLSLDFCLHDGRTASSVIDLECLLTTVQQQDLIVELDAYIDLSSSPSVLINNQIVKPVEQK